MKASESVVMETPNKTIKNSRLVSAFSIVSVVIVLFFSFNFHFSYFQTYDTLIMEVNPSVELVMNRYDRVIDLNFLNQDAQEILDITAFKNKTIDEAIRTFIITLKEHQFFDETQNEFYLTLSSNHANAQTKLNQLEQKTNRLLQQNNIDKIANCQQIDKDEYEELKNANLTPAKHKIIQEILAIDPNYTIETLSQIPLGQLRQILRELRN